MSPKNEFEPPDIGALAGEGGHEAAGIGQGESDPAVAAVLARETDALMKIDGVVMVGEGLDDAGQPAIVVGVKQRHQLSGLPRTVGGVRVTGWVIGEVDALGR
jgi:hypothetical protein